MLGHDEMVANIVATFERATPADVDAGAAWYAEARATAEALAAGTALSTRQAAGIIAALSPRSRWAQNVRAAADVVNGRRPTTVFGANVDKAVRIAQGEDPDAVLSGPKVRAFFANIMGDPNAVTVDTWAARIALGETVANVKAPLYGPIADAYRAAARLIGTDPHMVQATTWIVERGAAD